MLVVLALLATQVLVLLVALISTNVLPTMAVVIV